MAPIMTKPGRSYPLGACVESSGVNFCLYSKSATHVTLLLFRSIDSKKPYQIIPFDRQVNQTDAYWHIFVEGVKSGALYGYRVDGPYEPHRGRRFDKSKVLVDPYACEIRFPKNYSRKRYSNWGFSTENCAVKSVALEKDHFDWKDSNPIHRSLADTVIYEMHVGGFTKHPNSGVSKDKRGTYAGAIKKIPYLKQLGITAVELLPVAQFDPNDAAQGKTNYWGYCPVGFFAPHVGYSSDQSVGGPVNEFKEMVRALHEADIEVIIDVVFNHSTEGNEHGPTLNFRGIENDIYYMLDNNDYQSYSNYSGCGNTCNTNNSIVRRMIRDALHYWVTEMHVDGFRFDLASVMTRNSQGEVLSDPPLLWSIDSDPILAGSKIIAEAWDAGGLYQVGQFVGDRWNEWNGLFRDDVRAFLRGDNGRVESFTHRLLGSPDLYYDEHHTPQRSINFITAHDGFTLHDLVSYNQKHNYKNGECNRDGDNHNLSYNFGVEGPTNDLRIKELRLRQMKNFMAITLLSLGTPMITMGDEVARTQLGNNNAYCQDGELSWFDWHLVEKNSELLRFVQKLIDFRFREAALEKRIHRTLSDVLNDSRIEWHGVKVNQPDRSEYSHSIALSYALPYSHEHLYFAINAYWESLTFELPKLLSGQHWSQVIDTAAKYPDDIYDLRYGRPLEASTLHVEPRSIRVLVADRDI